MNICSQCGNEIDKEDICPFCGCNMVFKQAHKVAKVRVFNIKENMPTCQQAIKILSSEINQSKAKGHKILKIIHGYGSSGKGGELRFCLREHLGMMMRRNFVLSFISGENLTNAVASSREWIKDYPNLRQDKDYNKSNRGVTFIIL